MCDTIQDYRLLEQKIYDVVLGFIEDRMPSTEYVLFISDDTKDIFYCGRNTTTQQDSSNLFDLSKLIRLDENNREEPDNDAISDVVSHYIFVR